ncbi:hypothetical protein LOTGIDRAFT_172074 [Lottia gigantea]|uniref:Peroxisomal leader peptide-processing protease n=1 Tax=Lottia gigantea TaxID=225164 RepID=V4B9Y7_LOTGI|nr:hypothetical protein LOTGIDRAFT_172074 [Lottia gigantea]ESP02417.1 hypothetical protein LOTGIDRAFT_172074 [Lottia gigantea]
MTYNEYKSNCMISVYLYSDNKVDGSCSGVILDKKNGLVLTSATVLAPLAAKSPSLISSLESSYLPAINENLLTVEVYLEKEQLPKMQNTSVQSIKKSTNQPIHQSNDQSTTFSICNSNTLDRITCHKSKIIQIFSCDNFDKAFSSLFGGSCWTFTSEDDKKDSSAIQEKDLNSIQELHLKFIPKFILLKISTIPQDYYLAEDYLPQINQDILNPHDLIKVCGTPFGNLSPEVFMNSWSNGIVSNVYGKRNCLLLTDARCVPGTEGGGVYTIENGIRKLSGVVVCSLCWKNNEWVGLSIICSIQEILDTLNRKLSVIIPASSKQSLQRHDLSNAAVKATLKRIVLVKVGTSWGSGILININPVLVLTCNHVVKDSSSPVHVKIGINCPLLKANIVYQHQQGVQFDVALLHKQKKCRISNQEQLEIASPTEGEAVLAIGYGVFSYDYNIQPSITSGIISKVLYFNSSPVLVQTTCAIHPGASGGALINQSGQLLGIIVSNTKDIETGASFPHISLCIPVITIWPAIKQYLLTSDITSLNSLQVNNRYIRDVWSLETQKKYSVVTSKL